MKRLLFFVLAALSLPFLGLGNNMETFGIGGGIKIGNAQISGGTGGECYIMTVNIDIHIANLIGPEAILDTPDSEPNTETLYYLPEGYPAIYLSYDFPQFSGSQELTTFTYMGEIAGEPYYSYSFNLSIDLEEWCLSGGSLDYTYSLTNEDGFLYDIHSYSAPGDIFSCQLFDLTCNSCEEMSCDNDSNQRWPYWSGELNPECQCEPDQISSGDDVDQRSSKLEKEIITTDIQISPNPFAIDFELEIEIDQKGIIELILVGINGKIIQQSTEQVEKGMYKKRYTTDKWPVGVYFLKIKSNNTVEAFRLMKLR